MNVSVQVVARAVLVVDERPASVVITADDIARGYVDVAEPIVIRVRTNSRDGYLLQAFNADPSITSVELSFANARMIVDRDEAWVQRPYSRLPDVMQIRARLHLAPESLPRVAPLPVTFEAMPR
jgi:hypothetical protein